MRGYVETPCPPKEGDVTFVHALALFKCDKCGELCQRLTRARVGRDGTVQEGERPAGPVVCNDCRDKEQAIIKRENRQAANRKSWATRQKKKLKNEPRMPA